MRWYLQVLQISVAIVPTHGTLTKQVQRTGFVVGAPVQTVAGLFKCVQYYSVALGKRSIFSRKAIRCH